MTELVTVASANDPQSMLVNGIASAMIESCIRIGMDSNMVMSVVGQVAHIIHRMSLEQSAQSDVPDALRGLATFLENARPPGTTVN